MRFLGVVAVVLCVLIGIVYFSASYQLGREAKRLFDKGNYKDAHAIAMKALEKDPYNRSAFGIANQAKQRLNIQTFLQNTKESQEIAFKILKDGSLSPEEFLRLGWMVEEFQRNYRTLFIFNQPNPDEKERLEQYRQWFENLNQRLKEVKQTQNAK